MSYKLIEHIADDIKSLSAPVILLQNNDRFLYREDVIQQLKVLGISIVTGSILMQRVAYELRAKDVVTVLLCVSKDDYLEDMQQEAISYSIDLGSFLGGFYIPALVKENLSTLDALLDSNNIIELTKSDTIAAVEKEKEKIERNTIDKPQFSEQVQEIIQSTPINWDRMIELLSAALLKTIGKDQEKWVIAEINKVNTLFQEHIISQYAQLKSSSAIKKPKVVSKILDYIDANYGGKKVALIVVDGLAYWQYLMLKEHLKGEMSEQATYAWLPTITQLSRQAIFRGQAPLSSYKQAPVNERKLWESYWTNKGLMKYQIKYAHSDVELSNLDNVERYGIVYKDLDDFMHSAKDYSYLAMATQNWLNKSGIAETIDELSNKGFSVILTADHGNVQAKGWRQLKQKEKLGTNKSGSRSERHIEYSEEWLKEELLSTNPELQDFVACDGKAMYMNNDLSFSSKQQLVTHGGSHLLEVMVPFIEITNA